MGLQSDLFRGDPALEACLIRDSAHVLQGAVGYHVAKIQTALSKLDGLLINPNELAAKRYGPSTAAAVLAFKRKRNIINWSYQRTADDIVGKMTIAALDRELLARQGPPTGDGVAICKFTDGRSYRPSGVMLNFALTGPFDLVGAPAPATPVTPLQHAQAVMATARSWANSALMWLRNLRNTYTSNQSWPGPTRALFDAVDTHFHLGRLPNVADHPPFLDKIITNYTNILTILNDTGMQGDDPTMYSDPADPRYGAYATAKIGGFADKSVVKKVWFHGLFTTVSGTKCRCAMIIHECGHSVATALHYAYGHPKASGGVAGEPTKGVTHPRNYANLTPDEALHNADTYATFAAHASTGNTGASGDIRPGAHDLAT